MKTPIGQQVSGPPWRLAAAGSVGTVAVALDLLLVHFGMVGGLFGPRGLAGLVSLAALLLLARGDRCSLGLKLTPLQGWGYWCRITLLVGLLMGVLIGGLSAIAWCVYRLLGLEFPVYATPPDRAADALVGMCVTAPLLEEPIYRIALCDPRPSCCARPGRWS